MGGAYSTYGERGDAYRVLVGKPQGNSLLGRPKHRWEDKRWIFRKWGGWAWTGLIWLRIRTDGGHL